MANREITLTTTEEEVIEEVYAQLLRIDLTRRLGILAIIVQHAPEVLLRREVKDPK